MSNYAKDYIKKINKHIKQGIIQIMQIRNNSKRKDILIFGAIGAVHIADILN